MTDWTQETLLSHLSYGYSLKDLPPPQRIPSTRLAREATAISTSSIGALDALPLELLHLILEQTDILSLLRFARTSLRARSVLSSLHVYNFLLAHAPDALRQLALTNLLAAHETRSIYTALLSTACSSCLQPSRATHFYLPSAQRICYSCRTLNPGLWLIPLSFARRCFRLSASSTAKLPLLHFRPDTTRTTTRTSSSSSSSSCGNRKHKHKRKSEPCVSLRDVRRLAEKVHGSMEEVYRLQTKGGMHASCLMEAYLMQFLRDAPCQPFTPFLLASTGWWEEISEYLARLLDDLGVLGRECVPLPWPDASVVPLSSPTSTSSSSSSTGEDVMEGYWCQGCSKLAMWYLQGRIEREVYSTLVPGVSDGFETIKALYALSMRVRSKDEFWRHVATCYAVQHNMPDIRLVLGQLHLR
ncbi:F-box domain-containing protein [Trichophyton interdigitale]|nr:F-box domain-containing protein [Trichophyton interdigitale]KAG5216966.1 F-box domain-containing protein [Trichophyton interdigitale]KAG8205479.1 F-box domain-containing protein [Trichophyton interdigitale]